MSATHILVVDDEPDIRGLVKEILEDEGYAVAVAENGEAARHALRDRRPDNIEQAAARRGPGRGAGAGPTSITSSS